MHRFKNYASSCYDDTHKRFLNLLNMTIIPTEHGIHKPFANCTKWGHSANYSTRHTSQKILKLCEHTVNSNAGKEAKETPVRI